MSVPPVQSPRPIASVAPVIPNIARPASRPDAGPTRQKDAPVQREPRTESVQIVTVRPVQPVIVRHEHTVVAEPPKQQSEVPLTQPEVQSVTALPEIKPEEKAAEPLKSEDYSSERKEKPPISEGKASETAKKRKVRYEGEGGRIHTESQIDEILDFYLMTGELPIYVSNRQRYDYRHHERLPERKELLEQRGVSIVIDISGPTRRAKNVIPIQGAKSQRKKRVSS